MPRTRTTKAKSPRRVALAQKAVKIKPDFAHKVWNILRHARRHTWFLEGVFGIIWILLSISIWWARSSNLQWGSVLGVDSNITAQGVLEAVNNQRRDAGLNTLTWNDTLAKAAQAKAQDMLAKDYWAHVTPEGRQPWSFVDEAGYSYRVAGENLARNFSSTPNMVSAWLASPSHRANLLHQAYQETGIAAVPGRMDGKDTVLVVQIFASPTGAGGGVVQRPAGEVSPQAQNITRWFAPEQANLDDLANRGEGNILGARIPFTRVHFYRTGMVLILGAGIALLVADAFHPRHRASSRKHPLLVPSRHTLHIALVGAAVLVIGFAEFGNLL